jgi:hypothetical protein
MQARVATGEDQSQPVVGDVRVARRVYDIVRDQQVLHARAEIASSS